MRKSVRWPAAALALLLAGVPAFQFGTVPYQVVWGQYRVVAEALPAAAGEAEQRVRIVDRSGRTVREVRDYRIASVGFVDLVHRGSGDLHVATYSGGAHCCTTDYYFARSGGVRNLLIFEGGNGGVYDLRDFDRNGRPELIAANDALAYFDDLCYVCSPGLEMVIGWTGSRYADMTTRFPGPALQRAAEYRKAFVEALTQTDESSELARRGTALGYYANMTVAGQGASVRAWLLGYAPRATREWLQANESEMRAALQASRQKIRVSQQPVFAPPR